MFKIRAVIRLRAKGRDQVSISSPMFFILPGAIFHFSIPKPGNFFLIDAHSQDTVTIAKMFDTNQNIRQ